MDPSRAGGPGGDGEAPGGGRGRAQMLQKLQMSRRPGPGQDCDSSIASSSAGLGRGALLRGLGADSTVGGSSITAQEPSVSGGRGALLRNLAGVSQSSSSVVSSAATSRQEFLANLQQKRQEAAIANSVVPKPIGRAGLVSNFSTFSIFISIFSNQLENLPII